MKKLLTILLTVALLFGITACSSESAPSSTGDPGSAPGENASAANGASPLAGDPSEEYYMVSFLSGIDYWKTCFRGMEDAAELYGVKAQYTGETTSDVAKQVAVLEQVIAMQPKGITVTCVNAEALKDPINKAISEGIAVVTFDSDSPESNRASYLSTGNEQAGEDAAVYLSDLIGGSGKVAILYTIGAENSEARVTGFKKWCDANAPGISYVDVNDAGDTITATNNMAAALQANDDIAAVFCVDGIAGTAGPTAVNESGKEGIRVLAFDVDTAVLDMIKSGQIDATVAQGQYNMGYWSMNFLYQLAHDLPGDDLPGFVDTGVTIVTQENVESYYVK